MFVFSNLATSLDGKIATASREHFPLGSRADLKEMIRLREKADVVIMGASTLRSYRRFCGAGKRKLTNAIVSHRLEGVSPEWPFFKAAGKRRILFVTGKLSPARAAAFAKTSEIVSLKKGGSVARQIIAELTRRGCQKLLVEGGGGLMWDFVAENLIDEYHVTLTPRILGGSDAPTLVEGAGFRSADTLRLELLGCRRKGDELFLVYGSRPGQARKATKRKV